MADSYDCVVVGAGWFGIAAAKVYIELHPEDKVLVLEASGTFGGTWAEDRLYPGLKSNNLHGAYEYPDFPMHPELYGVQPGEHIPGAVIHRYLTDYARKFGVLERTRFLTRVESVSPASNDTWDLRTSTGEAANGVNGNIHARKLILATGLTSTPNMPIYRGSETFKGPLFHAKDFCRNAETVKTAQNVVVIGGAKSAYDVAYAYADAGAQVDIIIRPTGKGPVWIAYPFVDLGLRLEKLLHVRALTCFSPCPWGAEGGYGIWRRFLHCTIIGRWLVDAFWRSLGSSVVAQNGYASHPELKKLQPWDSPFWIGSGLSIHNYDHNMFEMVKKGQIKVHISDVDQVSEKSVHLNTGERLQADVIVCSTGWKKQSSIKFIDFPAAEIGLGKTSSEQAALNAKADQEVFAMFPKLKEQPTLRYKPKLTDPLRLYRFIVPPTMVNKRNLAFAGMVSSVSTTITAHIQALWISAFFDDKLFRIARSEYTITEQTMLHSQWAKWRHPCGYGPDLPDFAFDSLPYVDAMVTDLGLTVNRKPNSFKELFSPYGPEDYVGIIDEWKVRRGGNKKLLNGF